MRIQHKYSTKTEEKVAIKAIFNTLFWFANTMGITSMSGGMGKNILSEKDTIAKVHSALLLFANFRIFPCKFNIKLYFYWCGWGDSNSHSVAGTRF